MAYVAHDCKNCKTGKCNNRWLDKDLTGCKSRPPMWKYCKECCAKMGIDFNAQVRPDGLTQTPDNSPEIEDDKDS